MENESHFWLISIRFLAMLSILTVICLYGGPVAFGIILCIGMVVALFSELPTFNNLLQRLLFG